MKHSMFDLTWLRMFPRRSTLSEFTSFLGNWAVALNLKKNIVYIGNTKIFNAVQYT